MVVPSIGEAGQYPGHGLAGWVVQTQALGNGPIEGCFGLAGPDGSEDGQHVATGNLFNQLGSYRWVSVGR